MSMVPTGVAAGDDLSTGHTDIDDDVVDVALLVMPVRRFNRDTATKDAIGKSLELLSALLNGGLYGRRRVHVLKMDLWCDCHTFLLRAILTCGSKRGIRETA
jgi:hypothetical protein